MLISMHVCHRTGKRLSGAAAIAKDAKAAKAVAAAMINSSSASDLRRPDPIQVSCTACVCHAPLSHN